MYVLQEIQINYKFFYKKVQNNKLHENLSPYGAYNYKYYIQFGWRKKKQNFGQDPTIFQRKRIKNKKKKIEQEMRIFFII